MPFKDWAGIWPSRPRTMSCTTRRLFTLHRSNASRGIRARTSTNWLRGFSISRIRKPSFRSNGCPSGSAPSSHSIGKCSRRFWLSESLVNEVAGDDVFKEVIKAIETDPNGPRINVDREFVRFLGERATIISDYREPIDTKSERVLMAIEVTDPQSVMAAVNKAMKSDPDAKMIVVDGHTIWEMTQEETFAIEEIKIDGADQGAEQGEQGAEEEEKKFRPNAAVTVAHGHLLIATHVDYLVDLLKQPAEGSRLSDAADYQRTMAAIKQLGAKSDSFRLFARTDHAYRVTYEMIRQNKMPESESLLAKLLNEVFAPDEEDTLREPQFDGGKLPEFEKVMPYLGPAGMFFRTEDVGWSISGCLLTKPQ